VNFGSELNGTNGDVLEGSGCCSARAAASNRTMKISASMLITLWIKTAEHSTNPAYASGSRLL
jgi:hypothetical protein